MRSIFILIIAFIFWGVNKFEQKDFDLEKLKYTTGEYL